MNEISVLIKHTPENSLALFLLCEDATASNQEVDSHQSLNLPASSMVRNVCC